MLLIVPEYFSTLGIQWGNFIYPMLLVWALGAIITYRVKRFHITLTYVLSFIALSYVRHLVTGHPFSAEIAPITGPMYQLFIFFMITDPRTTVRSKKGQILVAFLVAVAEMSFRLAQGILPQGMEILSIDAPYYALTVVGPIAMAIDIYLTPKKDQPKPVSQGAAGGAVAAAAV